jgi:hypothetical protein
MPRGIKMSSPPLPTIFFANSPFQTGATIQNPLRSAGIRANPNTEVFYVLDRAQGFFQVFAHEAPDYREIGYVVFDGYVNRVTHFHAAYNAAVVRHPEADQANTFYQQNDGIWELIDMAQAMANAREDESIHFSTLLPFTTLPRRIILIDKTDFEIGRWYRKKTSKATPKNTPTKDRSIIHLLS